MTSPEVIIDGSEGEGGGQILRTSLALSLITRTPFRLVNIRARRAKPGLMRQHLTCVLAAAEVGNAEVHGAAVGSTEIDFRPNAAGISPRHFNFLIGTAGSTTLVTQTVLPALMLADAPSTVTIEGGTHNTKAPTFDYLDRVFLPLINRMGPRIAASIERHGFYPAGGGRISIDISPTPRLSPLHLHERGEIVSQCATALIVQVPGHVAHRELGVVREKLGWSDDHVRIHGVRDSRSPGNALILEIRAEHITEMFTAIGEAGKPAETVATEAADEAAAYLASAAPVGPHLADQLLLPLALAGEGSFITGTLTLHTLTNIQTIEKFLPITIEASPTHNKLVNVRVSH